MKTKSLIKYLKFIITYAVTSFLPINKKKMLFISMSGNSYGGNPKAFSDYLMDNNSDVKRVWAFSDIVINNNCVPNKCELYTFSYYFNLLTSSIILSDQRLYKPMMPTKRKGQIYLQTWHGTALKKIEADMPELSIKYEQGARRDSHYIDAFLTGSNYMTDIYKKSFWYSGKILEFGTPRNDIFFRNNHSDIKKKVYDYLSISYDKKIVMYAPTFRGNKSFDSYTIDSNLLLASLGGRDKDWEFVIRLHPNLISEENIELVNKRFPNSKDATLYPDMQELLVAADILITDYSSSMFDIMYTYKPCFIYAVDISTYDRGFYLDINSLPFPIASSMEELVANIKFFDHSKYSKRVDAFLKEIGNLENGNACKNLYNYISSIL